MNESLPSAGLESQLSERSIFGLVQSDRIFLLAVTLCSMILLGLKWWNSSTGIQETIEIQHLQQSDFLFQIDINSATWVEWMQLDGIGETTARNIVSDRESNGPFQSVNDVQRIRGIGPKTLEKMRPHLFCDSCNSTSSDQGGNNAELSG